MKYGLAFSMLFVLAANSSTWAQGDGPVPDGASLEEKVNWLIGEVGVSDDRYTIRDSIDATDEAIAVVVEQLQEDSDLLKEESEVLKELANALQDEFATTDQFVFGVVLIVLIALTAYIVRLRVRVAYLEGLMRTGQGDSGVVPSSSMD